MQIVYSSFEDIENSQYNSTSSPGKLNLRGIYLDGSIYHDLKIDVSKYTSYLKPFHLMTTKTDTPNYGDNAYDLSYNNGEMNGFAISQYLDGKILISFWDIIMTQIFDSTGNLQQNSY